MSKPKFKYQIQAESSVGPTRQHETCSGIEVEGIIKDITDNLTNETAPEQTIIIKKIENV